MRIHSKLQRCVGLFVLGTALAVLPQAAGQELIDLEIEGGQLRWNGKTVPARVDRVAEVLREQNYNVVVTSGAEEVVINELKLRGASVQVLTAALSIATDGRIAAGRQGSQKDNLLVLRRVADRKQVEVFNLEGYLNMKALINKPGDTDGDREERRRKAFESLLEVVNNTIRQARIKDHDIDYASDFRFHPGTQLLVVTGSPEVIDVVRKVVNALTGRQSSRGGDSPDTKFF